MSNEKEMDVPDLLKMFRTHDMYECFDCESHFMFEKGTLIVYCSMCNSLNCEFLYNPEEHINFINQLKETEYWDE